MQARRRGVAVYREQHGLVFARGVRQVDASVGADEAVVGLADQHAVAASHDAPALSQDHFDVARIPVVFCPSNPVVSIGPILAVPGVREALQESAAPVIAVSPIVAGAPVKGPADSLLRGIGAEVSARGVARLYRELVDGFVLDTRDRKEASDVAALGLDCIAVDTLMHDVSVAERLARDVLELADSLR